MTTADQQRHHELGGDDPMTTTTTHTCTEHCIEHCTPHCIDGDHYEIIGHLRGTTDPTTERDWLPPLTADERHALDKITSRRQPASADDIDITSLRYRLGTLHDEHGIEIHVAHIADDTFALNIPNHPDYVLTADQAHDHITGIAIGIQHATTPPTAA